jgi:hypothetical protein
MSKPEFYNQVLRLIVAGLANTQAAIVSTTSAEPRDVDSTLQRLRRDGNIVFNKPAKKWDPTEQGKAKDPQSTPSSTSGVMPEVAGVPSSILDSGDAAQTDEEKRNTMSTNSNTNTVAAIDAAINKAKAKAGQDKPASAEDASGERPKREKLTEEQRKARDEERAAERASKKTERDAVRAAKKAEKEAARKPAHMSKVDKAAERLPTLDDKVAEFFNELTVNFSASQLGALSSHLTHFNRVAATQRALNQKVTLGDKVKITGGDPRYIGKEGLVSKAQRIRCYVDVEGVKKPVYLFTSDVEVIASAVKKVAASA